jgi:hypothetical protein
MFDQRPAGQLLREFTLLQYLPGGQGISSALLEGQ